MQRTSSDLARITNMQRNSSTSSWTGSESPAVSPSTSIAQLPLRPLLLKTDSSEEPTASVASFGNTGASVSFTVGEEEDDGEGGEDLDQKELTKKDIHTLNEQRRRDVIKHGYATLAELVPTCQGSPGGGKPSRAIMLQKSIDYILFLQKQAVKQTDELEKLQREVKALEIMKENYEQIARVHQHTPVNEAPQVPDHVKFLVFQSIADQLFQSFNSSISVTSFDTLSSCIISWLEEYCKPQALRDLVMGNLQRVNAIGSSPFAASHTPPPQAPPQQPHPSPHTPSGQPLPSPHASATGQPLPSPHTPTQTHPSALTPPLSSKQGYRH